MRSPRPVPRLPDDAVLWLERREREHSGWWEGGSTIWSSRSRSSAILVKLVSILGVKPLRLGRITFPRAL